MIDKTERQHWLTVARVLAFCYVQTLTSLFCGRFPRKTVRGTGYLLRVRKINIPTLLHTWNVLLSSILQRSFNPGILIQFTFPSLLSYVWYISRLYNCKILGNFSHNHSLAVFFLVSVCPELVDDDCQTEAAFAQFSLSHQEWHPFEFIV